MKGDNSKSYPDEILDQLFIQCTIRTRNEQDITSLSNRHTIITTDGDDEYTNLNNIVSERPSKPSWSMV